MESQIVCKMLISKVNEVYLQCDVDEDLARELSDYFTFEVPGAKFMPQYRNRMWDGKIRLFSPHNGRIYVGIHKGQPYDGYMFSSKNKEFHKDFMNPKVC